jgi:hypothetical protein
MPAPCAFAADKVEHVSAGELILITCSLYLDRRAQEVVKVMAKQVKQQKMVSSSQKQALVRHGTNRAKELFETPPNAGSLSMSMSSSGCHLQSV